MDDWLTIKMHCRYTPHRKGKNTCLMGRRLIPSNGNVKKADEDESMRMKSVETKIFILYFVASKKFNRQVFFTL